MFNWSIWSLHIHLGKTWKSGLSSVLSKSPNFEFFTLWFLVLISPHLLEFFHFLWYFFKGPLISHEYCLFKKCYRQTELVIELLRNWKKLSIQHPRVATNFELKQKYLESERSSPHYSPSLPWYRPSRGQTTIVH